MSLIVLRRKLRRITDQVEPHLAEVLVWSAPFVLALLGHGCGQLWLESGVSTAGLDEKARRAIAYWRFLDQHALLFVGYGALLLTFCLVSKRAGVHWAVRILVLAILALPSLIYFRACIHLGFRLVL